MFIVQTLKTDRRQLYTRKLNTKITITQYMQWVDFRSVESSLLNSHLTYMVGTPSLILRPSAMVTHLFIPKCITPKCLAHSRDSSTLTFRPSVMVAPPFVSECITSCGTPAQRKPERPVFQPRDKSSGIRHCWHRTNQLFITMDKGTRLHRHGNPIPVYSSSMLTADQHLGSETTTVMNSTPQGLWLERAS